MRCCTSARPKLAGALATADRGDRRMRVRIARKFAAHHRPLPRGDDCDRIYGESVLQQHERRGQDDDRHRNGAKLPWKVTLGLESLAAETLNSVRIRDNLTLNVLMLAWPGSTVNQATGRTPL